MADVLVESAAHNVVHVSATRIGPVYTDVDTGYLFFITSTGQVKYRKTVDGGASWSSSVRIDIAGFAWGIDVWFDKWTPGDAGTLVHVWWMGTGDDEINYRSLDTAGDSLGTLRTVFVGTTFSSSTNRGVRSISGTKAVGGNLYVQFWGDTDEHAFYRSTDFGATWTARTDGADGDGADEVLCLPDDDSADNQDIGMIYWDRTADEITVKKYDNSANSWGETSISINMIDTEFSMQLSAVVRHSDGHIIVSAWSESNAPTADLRVFDIALSTPTITALTDVITNSDNCARVALFIDQNTDDLYVIYLGNEDGSESGASRTAFYKVSTDGGATWSSQLAYQENIADDERYVSAGHSTPGVAVGRYEPVFFNDDFNDLFVNKVNSVELDAAPPHIADTFGAHPSEHPIRADGASGAPTHTAPVNTLYVDEAADKLYVSKGAGSWVGVSLT